MAVAGDIDAHAHFLDDGQRDFLIDLVVIDEEDGGCFLLGSWGRWGGWGFRNCRRVVLRGSVGGAVGVGGGFGLSFQGESDGLEQIAVFDGLVDKCGQGR
ncbi:MAG: hypothetical protein PHT80_12645 [Lentisphaeria bacterium]|nr:hypothetical protein [Lentisphaeria bacterium]